MSSFRAMRPVLGPVSAPFARAWSAAEHAEAARDEAFAGRLSWADCADAFMIEADAWEEYGSRYLTEAARDQATWARTWTGIPDDGAVAAAYGGPPAEWHVRYDVTLVNLGPRRADVLRILRGLEGFSAAPLAELLRSVHAGDRIATRVPADDAFAIGIRLVEVGAEVSVALHA